MDLGYFKLLTTYNDVRTKKFYCYKNNSKVLYISDTKRLSDIALVIYGVCALAKLFTVLLVPVIQTYCVIFGCVEYAIKFSLHIITRDKGTEQ